MGRRGHQRLAGAAAGVPEPAAGRGRSGGGAAGQGAPRPSPAGAAVHHRAAGRAGRWSLVAPLLEPRPRSDRGWPTPRRCSCLSATACSHARPCWPRACEGGFAGVYGVLKVLEERGQVRRRLLRDRARGGPVRPARRGRPAAQQRGDVSGDDPGQATSRRWSWPPPTPPSPTRAALGWPDSEGRPARAAGALVVPGSRRTAAGRYRRGHHLVTFPRRRGHQLGRCPRRAGQDGRVRAWRSGRWTVGRSPPHRRSSPHSNGWVSSTATEVWSSGPRNLRPCPRVTPSIGPPQRSGPRCWRRSADGVRSPRLNGHRPAISE